MTVPKQLRGIVPAPNPAKPGERRAVSHGAYSEAAVAPVRARYVDELRAEYPDVHETVIVAQAARLARMELVYRWLDAEGIMHTKPSRKGDGWGVLGPLNAWERQAEAWHERRREEAREAKRVDPDAAWDKALEEFNPPDADVVEDDDVEEADDGD